jgi:hypothetical protein
MVNKISVKILYYFPEEEANMHQWQRIHFFDELAQNNIFIEVFNPLNYDDIAEAQNVLVDFVKNNKHRFDLFFTAVGDNFLTPDTVLEIKNIGLQTLLICFDNLHAPFIHKKLSPHFDLIWLTSIETEYMFKNWGANTIFLPYAANPFFFKPSDKPEINSVGFIGTPYGTRLKKLKQLALHDLPVSVYSNSFFGSVNLQKKTKRTNQEKLKHAYELLTFPIGRKILYSELINRVQKSEDKYEDLLKNERIHLFQSVTFQEMAELYSSFAISLGITDVRNTYLLNKPVLKLHLRTFEIPMSGGLQIINHTDEIASYFEENKEIILYKSDEELISKAKFYTQDSQFKTRQKMKVAARKRAESEHTWTIRFTEVFKKLGL